MSKRKTTKVDVDALRAAVRSVDPNADARQWATSDNSFVVARTDRGDASFRVSVSVYRRPTAYVDHLGICKTRKDRAVLRAVLDEIDRQGFR